MNASERCVVWSHAVVLQSRYGLHSLLWHVLLSQRNGHFLGAVVAEIDEYHHVALLDAAVNAAVVDRLDELVGHAVVITFLHCLHHIGRLLAHTFHDEVVAFLDTFPTFVAVHSIEAAHYACDSSVVVVAHLLHLLDEALS